MNDSASRQTIQTPGTDGAVSRVIAAAVASSAFAIPLAMSLSSQPSPNHPLIFLWYKTLRQPQFKPPDWMFPVAWTAIEAGLANCAYRLLRSPSSVPRRDALMLWGWNVLLIGGWSRLFFKRHDLAVSSLAAASLALTSAAMVKQTAKVDKVAAASAVPLVAWATFATVLTTTIWVMNKRRR
jgi:benzodiazapine receptor